MRVRDPQKADRPPSVADSRHPIAVAARPRHTPSPANTFAERMKVGNPPMLPATIKKTRQADPRADSGTKVPA
jgi:hypothetical protein